MTLLLFGANGTLGSAIVAAAHRMPDVRIIASLARRDVDVTHHASVTKAIQWVRPDAVLNCTAYHRVDEAEKDPALAYAVNSDAVRVMAEACADTGALFVHISTDYVFDGTKRTPYIESDTPAPLNYYGLSKLAGEQAITTAGCHALVIRTSALFGGTTGQSAKGGDFIRKTLAKAKAGEPLRIVDDLRFSPTYVPDLARKILEMVQRGVLGTYHITSKGETTWADFAHLALDFAGLRAPIERITSADLVGAAKRPAYSVLGTERPIFGGRLGGYAAGLKRYVQALSTGKEAAEWPPRT